MITFTVDADQGGLEIGADLGTDPAKAPDGIAIENATAVLGHEDQVDMHPENTVPS